MKDYTRFLSDFAVDRGTVSAAIVCVCKAGTHRSPAVARLITECLRGDGITFTVPRHISFHVWLERKRCYTCDDCSDLNPHKGKIFKRTYARWEMIGEPKVKG